uniref:Putative salivary short d7 protein 4 n=1 Tax=Culex tarsalis TaxID=7177 RepID=A0A1Q3FHK7_CULTA
MKYQATILVAMITMNLRMVKGEGSKIEEISVNNCEKHLKTTKPEQLCKMRKLVIDEATEETKDFGNCILKEFGYFNAEAKIDKSALIKDYREQGVTGKDAQLSSMIDECEREFGATINSVNYLLCITMEKDFASVINARKNKQQKWQPKNPVCK